MALDLWLRKLSRKILSRDRPSNDLFLDDKRFRHELAKERMRVDRNGSSFGLLTIELPEHRTPARELNALGRMLHRRLRITDSFGILSDGRVGVLLPDTDKSGAWKVASDVCSVYPVGSDRPNCEVFVYPSDDTHWGNGESRRNCETVEAATGATIESFFANPAPAWKRAIDLAGALTGLIAAAPLLLLIAAAVKLTSRGPVIYSQEREGVGGRKFSIYKFRTMRSDAESLQAALRLHSVQDGPAFKMHHDPRTTWVGHWLRVTSLDELPQLWNVLRGDMSLVGPRPLPTAESLECSPWQRQRLSVLPGMTGLWQVHGRNTVSFDQWMRMDLHYVRRRSLAYDLRLLLTTGPAVLFNRGPR